MERTTNEKQAAWEKRITEQKASGLSRMDWCARQGIKYTTYRYWLEQIGKRTEKNPNVPAVVSATPTWLELAPAPAAPILTSDGLVVRIGEATLELQRGFDPELLREIVRALASS